MQQADRNKEEFVHQVFSKIAHRYDLLNSLLSFNQDKYWRKKAVELTGLHAGGHALDVCCGTGMLTIELAKACDSTGRVIGLDFCEKMLEQASLNIAQTALGDRIETIQGNAMKLPFENNCFDTATIAFALRNVPDIKQTIAEMTRVVKPGGTVISLELAKPSLPVFKQLYYLYFEQLLPLLGRLGVGVDGPYRWLPESLRHYPHQSQVYEIFKETGLLDCGYLELTGGIVAIHYGVKQDTV